MLYLSGIILSFFLFLVLVTKKEKTDADYILLAWIGITGFHLLTFYLFFTQQYVTYPTVAALGFPLPLTHGPFLYLYTSQQISPAPFNKKRLLHFLPLVLSYLVFAPFYFLPEEQKVEVFRQKGQGFEIQSMVNLYAIYLSGVVYIILSLAGLLRYRRNLVHQFSNTDKINFNWLLYLILWMSAIWIVILFVHEDTLVFGAAALFVVWLGYFGIKQVQVFSHAKWKEASSTDDQNEKQTIINDTVDPDVLKYQKSSLAEQDASLIHERLKLLMVEQKPFKNPDLTLNELAGNLDVHPNHLSQVINSRENKNFYDLVNERRVEEFITLVSQPANQQYTLLAVAFDCGFNSKASFNRNFKKYTGLTPSDYLKQQPVKQ